MQTVKKNLFTLLISLLMTNLSFGQSGNPIPTLENLQSWAKMSYTKFDAEVKKFGFKLSEKELEDDGDYYIYTRSYSDEDNEVILFGIKPDMNVYIEMILYKNFFSSYQSSIKANKYTLDECSIAERLGVDTKDCKDYENDNYKLMLKEWRELEYNREKDKDSYSYSALILTKTPKKNAYEITVNVGNVAESTLILGYYLMGKTYIKDTVAVENGKAVFKGAEKLEQGMYLIKAGEHDWYTQFLIDDNQKFQLGLSMDTDGKSFTISSVSNSNENKLYYDLGGFIKNKRKEYNKLNSSDKTEQEKISQQVRNYQMQLIKNEPNSFTALIVKSVLEINIPESINAIADKDKREMQRYLYYKQHFFDQIDLSDSRLLRTEIYTNKIDEYINKLTTSFPDSIIVSIDYVVNLASKNSETYKNCLIYLLNYFAASKFVCYDKCYVHIVDKYYNNKNAPFGGSFWMNDEERTKIIKSAEKLRPILCDAVAPNVLFSSVADENDKFSLSTIKAKYIVLFFWEPYCGTRCDNAIAKLKEVYSDFKSKGIEVVGIGTRWGDTESNTKMIKEYQDVHKMPWLTVMGTDNKSDEIRRKYDINLPPDFYLLDANKKIILKRITVEDIIQYFKLNKL